jgi:hypothetical protein
MASVSFGQLGDERAMDSCSRREALPARNRAFSRCSKIWAKLAVPIYRKEKVVIELEKAARRGLLVLALALGAPLNAFASDITVYKSPTCGCCSAWVDHLKAHGFRVAVKNADNLGVIKQEQGVSRELASCHTATVEGYVIEGHVPAADIKRLLAERPAVAGLAVPGMPMGSPGMEGPRKESYQVISFDKEGQTAVFSHH